MARCIYCQQLYEVGKPHVCPTIEPPVAQAYRVPRPEDVRGETHGDFMTMAAGIQAIKDVMHASNNWSRLHSGQKEALELIATKIGRILTGDPGHLDHWQDGAGYFNKGGECCAAFHSHREPMSKD